MLAFLFYFSKKISINKQPRPDKNNIPNKESIKPNVNPILTLYDCAASL
jgi:hypothetical protein